VNNRVAEVTIKIPFNDLDPLQIVWHGNYLKYFEKARTALFDSFGLDLYSVSKEDNFVFPIITTQVKYLRPLRHRDEIICKATLVDARVKIIVDFEIMSKSKDVVYAKSRAEQAAVSLPDFVMFPKIPARVREACGF
jgi:acyl-CoA thioester hydrolase